MWQTEIVHLGEFITSCCWLDPEGRVILSSLLDCAWLLKTSGRRVLEVLARLAEEPKQWGFWTPQSKKTKLTKQILQTTTSPDRRALRRSELKTHKGTCRSSKPGQETTFKLGSLFESLSRGQAHLESTKIFYCWTDKLVELREVKNNSNRDMVNTHTRTHTHSGVHIVLLVVASHISSIDMWGQTVNSSYMSDVMHERKKDVGGKKELHCIATSWLLLIFISCYAAASSASASAPRVRVRSISLSFN